MMGDAPGEIKLSKEAMQRIWDGESVECGPFLVSSSQGVESGQPGTKTLLVDLCTRLRNVSDGERGQLLELSAPAAGVSGRLVADASGKLAGFPNDARAAALILAAVGILDEAQEILAAA